jgi:hypothetical protein
MPVAILKADESEHRKLLESGMSNILLSLLPSKTLRPMISLTKFLKLVTLEKPNQEQES